MGLNDKPSAERLHIGFFGLRNAGKSSLCNALAGQQISVVSDIKGTTTDPVQKVMELAPLGPVVIIDTPGLDDTGELGRLRVKRAEDMLAKTDLAVLVRDGRLPVEESERELAVKFAERKLPFLTVCTKADLLDEIPQSEKNEIYVSTLTGFGMDLLRKRLGDFAESRRPAKQIAADLVHPGDIVILVTPIDEAAPKGRLILPQQQTIRDLLDGGMIPLVCQDRELSAALQALKKPPALVITDSQAFGRVSRLLPQEIPLTSFSILFARYKGNLEKQTAGAEALSELKDGDNVLISEGCTHHRQCGDIGTVKLPALLKRYTGKKLQLSFTSGGEFPEDLSPYALVIHCGGCMLNEREMKSRLERAEKQGIPMTNYGTAIAQMNGILERSLAVFGKQKS